MANLQFCKLGERVSRTGGRRPSERSGARQITFALLLTVVIVLAGSAVSRAGEPRTLSRRFDVVTMTGDFLSPLHNRPIESLRLFRLREGHLEAIPFQIDEKDPSGRYVLTGGAMAGSDIDHGRLDMNDELVFLADDAGGRGGLEQSPEGARTGIEIELVDPAAPSRKAWAYLYEFPSNPPPRSPVDYLRYEPKADRVECLYYTVGYEKGYTFFSSLSQPVSAGGSGEDFIDRVKLRFTLWFFFNLIRMHRTEADARCRIIGWKDGPVRVLRNTENYFRILFDIPSPSILTVTEYYPHYFLVPLQFTVPFNLKRVIGRFGISKWSISAYVDFAPSMVGARFYTNRNQGYAFTGRTPQKELEGKVDRSGLAWGYIIKSGTGAIFPRLLLPEPFYQYCRPYLRDDLGGDKVPPETFRGELAGGAIIDNSYFPLEVFDLISAGTFEASMETYMIPSNMGPEGVNEWLRIRDQPIQVSTRSPELEMKKIYGDGNSKSVRAVVRDVRGRTYYLRSLSFYFGSSSVTPRNHTIGFDPEGETWIRVELDDVQRLDFRKCMGEGVMGGFGAVAIGVTDMNGKVRDLMSSAHFGFGGQLAGSRDRIYLRTREIREVEFPSTTGTDRIGGKIKEEGPPQGP